MALLLSFFVAGLLSNALAQDERFILPKGNGPYYTSLVNEEWVDESRVDPWNSSHVRRIMISCFEPVPPSDCKLIQVPYVTPVTAATEDEILGEYDYPKGLWARFYHEVCEVEGYAGKKKRGGYGERKYPIALFSPGLNTTRLFSGSLAQEIASHGYTVITLDHPYDTDVVEFPNGDVIYGGHVIKPINANGSTASVEFAQDVRADDASFVLDHLGIGEDEDVVMFGHSFGACATAVALAKDKRFRAGINLDGMMFGPNTTLGTAEKPQAFLLWGSMPWGELAHNTTTDPSWTTFWGWLERSPYVDYKKEFGIVNSTHGSFWDLNMLVDVAGIRDGLTELALNLTGPIPGDRMWEIMGTYIPAFFSYTLGLEPEADVLKGRNEKFPEVQMQH